MSTRDLNSVREYTSYIQVPFSLSSITVVHRMQSWRK